MKVWHDIRIIHIKAQTLKYKQNNISFIFFCRNIFQIIIDFFSATSTIFNLLTFGAIYVLRKKWPQKDRPYKALLYPWSMIFVLILYSSFLVITLITAFIPSLVGLTLTFSGTFYYLKKVKNKS